MRRLDNTTLRDQYFLKTLVGEGGMGQVYQAWDRRRSANMAIKVIHNPKFVESFIREAVALKELAHPNIVRFYSVEQDETKGIAFIVMDWVDGKDLNGILKKSYTPMGVGQVLYILEGVQKALHYAHGFGVCHCDIKPANILLRNSDNLPILSDFGLAHIAQDQGVGGTLPFMAPELFMGGSVSVASDIYALGVTLYQLLSRQLPFHSNDRKQIIQDHINKPPPPIQRINHSLSEGITYVIEKALSKDPKQRQSSVTQLWKEFSRYATGSNEEIPTQSSGLFGLSGEKIHQTIQTGDREITIGRSKKNRLRLRHPSVSRHHAVIFWKHGRYYIRDYGSSVGTFINGRKILANQPSPLRNGDKIKVGVSDVFKFRTKRK